MLTHRTVVAEEQLALPVIEFLRQSSGLMQFPIYIHLHFGRIVCRKSTCDVPLHHQTCAYESEWIHLIYRFSTVSLPLTFRSSKATSNATGRISSRLISKAFPISHFHASGAYHKHVYKSFRKPCSDLCLYEKRPVFHLIQSPFPVFGNVAVTYHGSQYTCCRCRVAVRILPSTGRDINGFCKITLSIEQS